MACLDMLASFAEYEVREAVFEQTDAGDYRHSTYRRNMGEYGKV